MVESMVISFGFYKVRVDNDANATPVIDIPKLAEALPHGSGIDGDWYISVQRNGDLTITGEYHVMDENGFYCGWRTFRFAIRRARKNKYHALATGKFQVTKVRGKVYLEAFRGGGDASDYLYDVVSDSLSEIGINAMDSIVVDSEDAARTFTL